MTWDYDAERRFLEGKGAWGEQPEEPPTPNPLDELASMFAPLGRWVADAACAAPDIDPTLFDEPGGDGLSRGERSLRAAAAGLVCAACPVRAECLADADENGLTGVRGGVLIFDGGRRRRDLLDHADASPSAA